MPSLSSDVQEPKGDSPAISPTPSGAASNFEIGEGADLFVALLSR